MEKLRLWLDEKFVESMDELSHHRKILTECVYHCEDVQEYAKEQKILDKSDAMKIWKSTGITLKYTIKYTWSLIKFKVISFIAKRI